MQNHYLSHHAYTYGMLPSKGAFRPCRIMLQTESFDAVFLVPRVVAICRIIFTACEVLAIIDIQLRSDV